MVDVVSPEKRSQMMSGIQGKNTRPEIIVRKGLHALGFRYRLHNKNIPGKPDLVFPRYKAVIFVNGCFWHHHDCHLFKWPSTRPEFWKEKINSNVERDNGNVILLNSQGWKVLTVWECALKGRTRLPQSKVIQDIASWLYESSENVEITGLQESLS